MSININKIISNVSNLNGDVFIIPNKATNLKHSPDFMAKNLDALCKVNGVSFDKETTKFVQTWICINDIYTTDNLFDNCLSISRGLSISTKDRSGRIPLDILQNVKEGDTFKIIIPCVIEAFHEDIERVEFNITLNLTACQTKYRYRNFGNFENCLNSIT